MARAAKKTKSPVKSKTRNAPAGKFVPAVGTQAVIDRESLWQKFQQATERAVYILQAPAGFGKTQLLSEWVSLARGRGDIAAWINVQTKDRALSLLWENMCASLSHAGVSIPDEPGQEDAESYASRLIAAIAVQKKAVFLVLDDYHMADCSDNNAFLQAVMAQMPANLRVAVSSRRVIGIPVSRVILQGRLCRIGKKELVFSKAEAKAFFAHRISPTHLKRIYTLTEGWPAALRMVEISLEQWRKERGDITDLPLFAALMTDYVKTEFLAGIDEEHYRLLRETAILETLEPNLVDAVRVRKDSAKLISALSERETFLYAVDVARNAWRLPPLVRWALEREFRKEGRDALVTCSLRAASWFDHHDDLTNAVRYYLAAGQSEQAAESIEQAGPLYIAYNWGDDLASSLIRALPEKLCRQYPRLMLGLIYLDYKRGLLDEAQHQFKELAAATDGFNHDRAGGNDARFWTEATSVGLFMDLYRCSSVSSDHLRKVEASLDFAPQTDPHLSTLNHMILAVLYHSRGDLDLAYNLYLQAEKINAQDYSSWEALWLKHHFGSLALARGQLYEARHVLHQGLRQWRAEFPSNRSFAAVTYLLLAEIDYEFDSLGEARAKVDEAMYTAEHVEAWFEHYVSAYETLTMLTYHAEGAEGVEALLIRLNGVLRVRKMMKNFIPALYMRLGILRDDYRAVRDAADKNQFYDRWLAADSHSEFAWREWDLIGLSLSRLAIHERDFDLAARVIERLERDIRLSGRLRSQVKVLILKALFYSAKGQMQEALRHLAAALDIGHTQGYFRCFLDEGRHLAPLLKSLMELSATAAPQPAGTSPLAHKLMLQLGKQKSPGHGEAQDLLSQREQQVLRELSLGHSNKLIARKMAVSEPTIKFHVQNIFRKLEVRNRASAIAEAHRRGLS